MEAPFDLLTYVSLVSALLVVMRCYITEYRQTKAFLYDVTLARAEREKDHVYFTRAMTPLRRIFTPQKRKIPVREHSYQSDEEGRRPLLFFAH
ncbi:hypothetical protein [Parageobacillus toebii]|uniref:hypothetical protein n=1 Tax=Parageobacillus toebii TaxID=153151 RepID=UPI002E1CF6DD|nr:hypothetical protein [Parageobacillus toebii]